MKTAEIKMINDNLANIRSKKLPIKMSFVLSRNLKKIDEVVKDVQNSMNDLLQKYGERDENGEIVVGANGSVRIDNFKDYMDEYDQIMDVDVDIILDKVSMSEVEKCENDGYDNLTVDEVSALEFMIMEDPNIMDSIENML